MKNRICLIAFCFLSTFSLFAAPPPDSGNIFSVTRISAAPPSAPFGPEDAVLFIRIGKEKLLRTVVIGLYDHTAPQTVENFKQLIRKRFYDGLRFHRVLPHLLAQTGDPKSRWGNWSDTLGTGGPGYTIPSEIRLPHIPGAVASARLPDDLNPMRLSNGSQFYICLDFLPKLNGKYTVFGHVLSGLKNIDEISNGRTDSNDFPLDKIVIVSITLQPHGEPVLPPHRSHFRM